MRLLYLFIFISVSSYGQETDSNVLSIFNNADSVLIVSHQSLRAKVKPGAYAPNHKLVINGHRNDSIICDIKKLDKVSIDSLAAILTTPDNGNNDNQLSCFEPHNGILIYRNGTASYFEICFDCMHLVTSKDIIGTERILSYKTWMELKLFFKNRQVRTGIKNISF